MGAHARRAGRLRPSLRRADRVPTPRRRRGAPPQQRGDRKPSSSDGPPQPVCGRFTTSADPMGKMRKSPCSPRLSTLFSVCPISHVPVAACWSVGIRTRGRTAARDMGPLLGDGYPRGKDPGLKPSPEQRPAAGGETGEPRSPRGTQLKATTERAFLVSAGFQIRRLKRLVHLARRAVGDSPSKQRQLLGRRAHCRLSCLHRTAGAMTHPR